MKFSGILRAGLALTGLCVLTVGGRAQQADAPQPPAQTAEETNQQYARSILTRTGSFGQQGKTSRVEGTLEIAAGNSGAASFQLQILHSGEKYRSEISPIGQGVGEVGKKMAEMHSLEIFDGKTTISLSNDTYTKKRGEKQSEDTDANLPAFLADPASSRCELLPAITMEGHPVFVIRVSPKEKSEDGVVMHMTTFIDQETYQLRKMEIFSGGDNPAESVRFTLNVTKMVLNTALSSDLFKFTPPKGAKEVTGTPETVTSGANPLQFAMAGLAACKTPKAK